MAKKSQSLSPARAAPSKPVKGDHSVARQPILDRKLRVVGYELLFRKPFTDSSEVVDDQAATSSVIVDSFMEIGLADIVGEHPAYINVTREFLLQVRPLPLPPKRVVLELLEDQIIDAELLDVLNELVDDGFTIALDDFVWTAGCEPLLELAKIVKVDVLAYSAQDLPGLVERLLAVRPPVKLLAEKVETREDFERCRELGFHSFQGYFFARPSRPEVTRLPSQHLTALSAMAQLNATEDFDELLRIITRDAGLSIRLLRYANSAYLYLPRRVGSVQEGLVLLGAITVRRFALMVALAGAKDVPNELLVTALIRARMCQMLSGGGEGPDGDPYFTVGLFSVADALADAPMSAVLQDLPFRPDVADALLGGQGPLGLMLQAVVAYERGDFWGARELTEAHPDLAEIYRQAVIWADLSVGELI